MNFLTNVPNNEPIIDTLGASETLIFGMQMVLLGMLTIFSVLLLIMIALYIFKAAFNKGKEQPNVTVAPTATAPVTVSAINDEVVVAIAAAIAMAESESNGLKFKVVSFRRK